MIKGFDISHHNTDGLSRPLDLSAAKSAGFGFAIVKATDGDNYKDPRFEANARAVQAAGMRLGAYHFFRPGDDPIDQAHNFLNQVHLIGGLGALDLLPWVDIEDPSDDPGAWNRQSRAANVAAIAKFLQAIDEVLAEKGLPTRCGIYCSPGWWLGQFYDSDFSGRPLWAARYGGAAPDLRGTCWETRGWTIWQYDEHGVVPGLGGGVDLNQMREEAL